MSANNIRRSKARKAVGPPSPLIQVGRIRPSLIIIIIIIMIVIIIIIIIIITIVIHHSTVPILHTTPIPRFIYVSIHPPTHLPTHTTPTHHHHHSPLLPR